MTITQTIATFVGTVTSICKNSVSLGNINVQIDENFSNLLRLNETVTINAVLMGSTWVAYGMQSLTRSPNVRTTPATQPAQQAATPQTNQAPGAATQQNKSARTRFSFNTNPGTSRPAAPVTNIAAPSAPTPKPNGPTKKSHFGGFRRSADVKLPAPAAPLQSARQVMEKQRQEHNNNHFYDFDKEEVEQDIPF